MRLRLESLSDMKYRDFTAKLIPNLGKDRIMGVRTPDIRALAKELYGTKEGEVFLSRLPHYYLEENKLHATLVSMIKDYDKLISELDRFLPFVDNWAVCDAILPALFRKHPKGLPKKAEEWCDSVHTYTARFGINVFMGYYLDGEFKNIYLDTVASVKGDYYYIKMGKAWYFATALAKQYDAALPVLIENRLDAWTHNKTISKARDSYRIPDETKKYLKTLRREVKADGKINKHL